MRDAYHQYARRLGTGAIPQTEKVEHHAEVRDRTRPPGCREADTDELRDISAKSNKVLSTLGPEIRWLQSYVTDDKLYCVYVAPDEDIIIEHARCGGFPVNKVTAVSAVIDPSTGE